MFDLLIDYTYVALISTSSLAVLIYGIKIELLLMYNDGEYVGRKCIYYMGMTQSMKLA